MKYNSSPIGIFDSGIGGTSIWKEITNLLPNENTIYLSDSLNAPYGEKTKNQIIDLSKKNTDFLIKKHCKLIVVACNTATTNAIKILRSSYAVPFIGIEPAIKPASLKTKSKIIGVLATKGTLSSELFEKTSNSINSDITIREIEGKGLVKLIESGKINSPEMTNLLRKYLDPLIDFGIDCLVLGCTHYPYLIPKIKSIIGENIEIIDSGQAVARQTKAILNQNEILNSSKNNIEHYFYINKDKSILKNVISDTNFSNTNIIETSF